MDEVKVISAEKDGADLRREKARARHYVHCDGKADEEEINDAIGSTGRATWFLPAKVWERIFGGRG